MVVEARRLGSIDAGLGAQPFAGERAAGDQPAAGRRRRHRVEGEPLCRCVRDRLHRRGALPGDDQRIVEGSDQCGAALGDEAVGDALAALGAAVVKHDLGAVAACVRNLDTRGVGRHDDDGLDVQKLGRAGDALGMIAGGKRHHPALSLGRAQGRETVEGAPELERAGALQALGLEEKAVADPVIDPGNLQEGGVDGPALEPGRGGFDIGKTGQIRHSNSQNRASCPCDTYPSAIYKLGAADRRAKF